MVSDAALRALASSGAVGLCTWTLGRDRTPIITADDAFLAIVGRDREALTNAGGLDWRALTPSDWMSEVDERQAALLESGSHGPRDQELLSRDGERVPVMVSSALVDGAAGEAVSLCVDLTHQVRARADAERASHAKSRFLGVMSHELRTPLNTIIGQAELLAEGTYGVVTDGQRDALGRLRGASVTLRSLVEKVLLFSRLESGEEHFATTALALAAPLAAAAAASESRVLAKSLSLVLHPPPSSLHVMADADKLQQVLLALLSNAIKFTPTGGNITIDTAVRAEVSDHVFVRVADTGSGVARERHRLIFQPFTQLDDDTTRVSTGLGLGLAISRDLARGMGGDLRVRSGDSGGATFTLSLRMAPAGEPGASAASAG